MSTSSDGIPVSTASAGINRQTADVTSSDSYRGNGHRSQNRRENRRNTNGGHTNTTSIVSRARFEGREPSMRGYIYDFTGERNPEQWIKTTKEIISYVGRTYTRYTSEFTEAVKELRLTDPVEPTNPDPTNPIAFELWKIEIREYKTKVQEFNNFRAGLYSLVLGQCSEALEDRLRSHHSYPGADQDGIALLSIIKTLLHTFEERQKLADSLAEVKEKFYSFRQGRHMSLQRYHELFLAQVEVLREVGVSVADSALIESVASSNGRRVPNKKDQADAQEQALAIKFIRGTNQQYSSYLTHLRNSFLDGNDNYPVTLHAAYNILQRRESEQTFIQSSGDGIAFANVGSGSGNTSGSNQVICYNCGQNGHYANNCPNTQRHQDQNGVAALTYGTNEFLFSQVIRSYHIPDTWILLDSQSTIDLFCNATLLYGLQDVR